MNATTTVLSNELARRLEGPQRHRLLQGYPMLPLMRPAAAGADPDAFPIDRSRRLIAGVLPHPFCNPTVQGCGFCTFPHERYRNGDARAFVERVIEEVKTRTNLDGLRDRAVDALYVGGGTANLTPPDALEKLLATLASRFDLSNAELTLEGAPVYFLTRDEAHLHLVASAPAATKRVSMGVQTFDPAWLAFMGRTAFGDRDTVARVIERAHALGLATSVDLLVNLPGQTRDEVLADVRNAIALGADQVCVYHLVLFEGLGTEWSKDRHLLMAMPSNDEAFASWLAARDELLACGFVQATLTNFERQDVHLGSHRFVYETMSFTPERYDGVGFGPNGISTFTVDGRALKVVNGPSGYEKRFDYDALDLKLLHLTRTLPRLAIDRDVYRASFGVDPVDDFRPVFEACAHEGLLVIDDDAIRLTPRGSFHADSIAGLLAWPRALELRRRLAEQGAEAPVGPGESAGGFMG